MIRFSVPFIALMLAFSGTANAKFIGRWDPAAYAQGKFEIQKTAFVQKEPVVEKIQIESKHILVKVDYTGKIFCAALFSSAYLDRFQNSGLHPLSFSFLVRSTF